MSKASATPSGFSVPWRLIIAAAIVCIGLAVLSRFITIDMVHEQADRLNPFVAFALLTVLPLVGFPVSVLHVVAGIRFGTGLGLALVALSILLQLLASYVLVHGFRRKFSQRLAPVREKIPRGAHGAMCLFTMLIPGVPYFAKNYVLPLLGVPLHTYLIICLPIHVVRSSVAIFLGDKSDELTPGRIVALVVYFSATLFASWWMYRRLRSQMRKPGGGVPATTRARHA
ncbi:MAG TPA: hypothetical protein VHO24_11760 [Opitutaceae bacterium]|nr:hypothetical protein [Opitutaceae bacterium]